MAKLDLSQAYRRDPVHPEDQFLLGLYWYSTYYIDIALPLGLHSAPKIFTALADALAWAMAIKGIHFLLHYLDDFSVWPPSSLLCQHSLDTAVPLCSSLGLPVDPHKVEGSTTCLTFLGIEIDSLKFELQLPPAKLRRLQGLIQDWVKKRSASKHLVTMLYRPTPGQPGVGQRCGLHHRHTDHACIAWAACRAPRRPHHQGGASPSASI